MNKPSVLVDGTQLRQRRGTGIASYTRSLVQCLHFLGASVDLLLGAPSHLRRADPTYSFPAQVFGHRPSRHRFVEQSSLLLRTWLGLKRTVNAVEVKLEDIDLSFIDPPLPPFDRVFNADAALGRASAISIWGSSMLGIVPPRGIAATHWTGPTPLKTSRGPNLYTIHDLIPIRYPYFVIDRPGHSARLHAAIAREADCILTISETSKEDIVRILGVSADRVFVTYQPAPKPPLLRMAMLSG